MTHKITHILSNLPEAYKNIIEKMEDNLEDRYDPLALK